MDSPQRLMLGETCLDDYVSEPVEAQEADKKIKILMTKVNEINEFINENSHDVKSAEIAILKNITQNRDDYLTEIKQTKIYKKYSELNLSFLSMYNKVNGLRVPRFIPYKYNGNNKFKIEYDIDMNKSKIRNLTEFPDVIKENLLKSQAKPNKIPSSFKTAFAGAVFGAASIGSLFYNYANIISDTPTKILLSSFFGLMGGAPVGALIGAAIGSHLQKDVELSTELNLLIPQTTKEKAERVKEDFDRELYLIAEAKPEEWNQKMIKTDPLLIGIIKNKSYLIDHFNCTSLENYVRRKFTS